MVLSITSKSTGKTATPPPPSPHRMPGWCGWIKCRLSNAASSSSSVFSTASTIVAESTDIDGKLEDGDGGNFHLQYELDPDEGFLGRACNG